ncbi:MAG: ThuA domain-containing protein [Sphingomonadales bacterium]|nr:MAG: ThuA domain-containing protein [Sphingomonadales bacterium]
MTIKSQRLEVFVATKGHAFQRDAFETMLRAIGVEPTFVDQPGAAMLMNPEALRGFDAILLYDMPGMNFRAPMESRPEPVPPPPALVAGFEALLAEGKGIVALHHALAGWPGWPGYGEALGGAFLYRPGRIRGEDRPSSGYVADVRYQIRAATTHPVLDGVPLPFELEDEPYLHDIFHDEITPLLLREPVIEATRFQSACHAVRRIPEDRRADWQPPVPSPVIGWAKAAHNSPLVYLQPGDGPQTYAHPGYRQLLGNALRWVASPDARDWVREQRR